MNRKTAIVIAGSLTGLVLITILALGFGRVNASSNGANDPAPAAPQFAPDGQDDGNSQQELKALQDYSRQLEQTLLVMQDRESQYQQELNSANNTIGQLQDELNGANRAQPRIFFREHEEHEHELGEFDD